MNDVQAEFGLGNAVPPRASLRAGSRPIGSDAQADRALQLARWPRQLYQVPIAGRPAATSLRQLEGRDHNLSDVGASSRTCESGAQLGGPWSCGSSASRPAYAVVPGLATISSNRINLWPIIGSVHGPRTGEQLKRRFITPAVLGLAAVLAAPCWASLSSSASQALSGSSLKGKASHPADRVRGAGCHNAQWSGCKLDCTVLHQGVL